MPPNQALQQTGAACRLSGVQALSAAPAAELCRSAAEGARMAKQKRAALSDEFDTTRLDAIGKWKVVPDPDILWIDWRQPVELRGDWVPLDLRFSTSFEDAPPTASAFDPDDRMFALYELFRVRRAEFVQQLRALVAVAEEVVGPAKRGRVEVDRYDDSDPEMAHCYLRVSFEFAEDDEHSSFSRLNPESGQFEPLEG